MNISLKWMYTYTLLESSTQTSQGGERKITNVIQFPGDKYHKTQWSVLLSSIALIIWINDLRKSKLIKIAPITECPQQACMTWLYIEQCNPNQKLVMMSWAHLQSHCCVGHLMATLPINSCHNSIYSHSNAQIQSDKCSLILGDCLWNCSRLIKERMKDISNFFLVRSGI